MNRSASSQIRQDEPGWGLHLEEREKCGLFLPGDLSFLAFEFLFGDQAFKILFI